MANDDIHVYPVNDLQEHVVDGPGCPCNPRVEVVGANLIYTHNAWDNREMFEQINEFVNTERDAMDLKTAREVAARVWCDPEMSGVAMDYELCEAIAQLILKAAQHNAHMRKDTSYCPHISERADGTCPYCDLPKPPNRLRT